MGNKTKTKTTHIRWSRYKLSQLHHRHLCTEWNHCMLASLPSPSLTSIHTYIHLLAFSPCFIQLFSQSAIQPFIIAFQSNDDHQNICSAQICVISFHIFSIFVFIDIVCTLYTVRTYEKNMCGSLLLFLSFHFVWLNLKSNRFSVWFIFLFVNTYYKCQILCACASTASFDLRYAF